MKSVDETKEQLIERVDHLNLNMIEWELLVDDDPGVDAETLIRDNYKNIHLDILKLFSLEADESLRNAAQEALEKLASPEKEYAVIQNNDQLKQMIDYLHTNGYRLFHEDQVLVLDPKTKTAEFQPLQAILESEELARNPSILQAVLQSPSCPISLVNHYLDHDNADLQRTAKAVLQQRIQKENTQAQLHDKHGRSLDERLDDARNKLAQRQEADERTMEKQQDLER